MHGRVHAQAPAGAFQTASWPEALPTSSPAVPASPGHMLESVLSQRLGLEAGAGPRASLAQQAGADAPKDQQWRLQVPHLQQLVDEGLWQCLQNALLLCADMVSLCEVDSCPSGVWWSAMSWRIQCLPSASPICNAAQRHDSGRAV